MLALAFVTRLWFFPRWIAVGVSLIGLWLMTDALAALMRNLLLMYLFRSGTAMDMSGLRGGLLYYALESIVGVALLFGANGIKRLIVRSPGALRSTA